MYLSHLTNPRRATKRQLIKFQLLNLHWTEHSESWCWHTKINTPIHSQPMADTQEDRESLLSYGSNDSLEQLTSIETQKFVDSLSPILNHHHVDADVDTGGRGRLIVVCFLLIVISGFVASFFQVGMKGSEGLEGLAGQDGVANDNSTKSPITALSTNASAGKWSPNKWMRGLLSNETIFISWVSWLFFFVVAIECCFCCCSPCVVIWGLFSMHPFFFVVVPCLCGSITVGAVLFLYFFVFSISLSLSLTSQSLSVSMLCTFSTFFSIPEFCCCSTIIIF